jgi:thiamine biosynthesis lipoprotein
MGTTYMVKIITNNQFKSGELEEITQNTTADIKILLKKINRQMSAFLKDSEISRFNRYGKTDWFEVSADTAAVIAEALRVSEISNGAFDITVGPLINLWGFGTDKKKCSIPGEQQIKEWMDKIGYQKLSVRHNPPAVKKEIPLINCNLSALAKGFGVDKTAQYLESKGFINYLVEIGGEVRARGVNHNNKIWRVGIATPDTGFSLYKVFPLKDSSMATSGDYRNYFETDGERYSHTIDPTTGRPITHKLVSVTVIHDSCMRADAMATAITVLGPKRGYELAIKENLRVFMIVREKDTFIGIKTPQFQD